MLTIILFLTTVAYVLPYLNAANVPEESKIIYEGPIQETHDYEDIPEACKDLTYCTIRPKTYPQDKKEWLNHLWCPTLATVTGTRARQVVARVE
ncbi:unnamed protein product [Leptidea sinapis]|uniref:Uncharacterized protein n=1 Tax=Leptidea sinapis TaxID=189913 RepID=A0A5E4QLG7_9NEOP|nr:unnamed protein product [Leptidea sinapis]